MGFTMGVCLWVGILLMLGAAYLWPPTAALGYLIIANLVMLSGLMLGLAGQTFEEIIRKAKR